MRICEAGRELNGRHSTIAKWHFSLHRTYSTVPTYLLLPNPAHAATHPPTCPGKTTADQFEASLRDWDLLNRETVALGSCHISSPPATCPRYRAATAPALDGDRLPQSIHPAATTEAFPTDSCPDASAGPAPHPPPLAGWLALILEPRGRCTGLQEWRQLRRAAGECCSRCRGPSQYCCTILQSRKVRRSDLCGSHLCPDLSAVHMVLPRICQTSGHGDYRDLGQRPDDRRTSFGLRAGPRHGLDRPVHSVERDPILESGDRRPSSLQLSEAHTHVCPGPESLTVPTLVGPNVVPASSRIAISSSCLLFDIGRHLPPLFAV